MRMLFLYKNKFGPFVLLYFFRLNRIYNWTDRQMDQAYFRDARMQFYTFVLFLDLPDDVYEEYRSFLDGRTGETMDGHTLLQRCEDASKNDVGTKRYF